MDIWPIQYFQKLINFLARISKIIGIIGGVVVAITNVVGELFSAAFLFFYESFETIDISALSNVELGTVDMMAYVNGVFPVSEFIALMTIYVTAWIIVISLRWLKSMVPTWSN